jgi:hypothetical protein
VADSSDKLDHFLERARSRAKEALDWSRRVSTVGRLKLDTTRLQRLRTTLYGELGQKTYLLLKEGTFNPSELDDLCTQIDDLNRRIEDQQRQMAETAGKPSSTDQL